MKVRACNLTVLIISQESDNSCDCVTFGLLRVCKLGLKCLLDLNFPFV